MTNNKYPYIGIHKYSGARVVFIDINKGFLLTTGRKQDGIFNDSSVTYHFGDYSDTWFEYNFVPENEELNKFFCVVVETKEELKEIEQELCTKKEKYFKHYYTQVYTLPALIWVEDDMIQHTPENENYHRIQYKESVKWSKSKDKARKILNIPTTVEMTLKEICEALGKNIKIIK